MRSVEGCVVGVGEIVFDHVYSEGREGVFYRHSRGGGTVWNVLANLAQMNTKTIAMGAYGAVGRYGELAKAELDFLGVDTGRLMPIAGKQSLVISEIARELSGTYSDTEFRATCPVCKNKTEASKLARLVSSGVAAGFDWSEVHALIADKLTAARIGIANRAREDNPSILTVLDLGRVGGLRFVPVAKIVTGFRAFDVVFLDPGTARSLATRLGIGTEGDLRERIYGDMSATLVVLAGGHGMEVYSRQCSGHEERHHLSAPSVVEVVDTAGAGDAAIASFLHSFLSLVRKTGFLEAGFLLQALALSSERARRPIQHLGARGHLQEPPLSVGPDVAKYRGAEIRQIRIEIALEERCPFCFSPIANQASTEARQVGTSSMSQIVLGLPSRLLFVLERHDAAAKCKKLLETASSACVVGTGGSFAPSLYISQLFREKGQALAYAAKPYDYYSGPAAPTEWLIVVSHSGSTADCALAIKRARTIGVARIALVTYPQRPRLAGLLRLGGSVSDDLLISYGTPGSRTERGFVNFAGAVMPCIPFAVAAMPESSALGSVEAMVRRNANESFLGLIPLAAALDDAGVIDVFGDSYSWPAAVDFESKLVEGGIGTARLHEMKDFSHGRFMSVLAGKGLRTPRIVFRCGADPYVDELVGVLTKHSASPVLVVSSEHRGLIGGLEVLVRVQFLAHKLALSVPGSDMDISRPRHIPADGLKLYRWRIPES